ncbi:MAG: DUF1565 domain-containing protein [Deltaproteobacteria bacterium]|nr:DUF1565 domain-containing protein [Deltaproteobacteria bacterium]
MYHLNPFSCAPSRGVLVTLLLGVVLLSLTACGGKAKQSAVNTNTTANTTPPPPAYDYYVNAATGSDANAGTEAAPFKTITKAMSVAVTGKSVKALPGTYDAANGETFPIAIPAGVSLFGDETTKGTGVNGASTSVIGGGVVSGTDQSVFKMAGGALVAGLFLNNPTGHALTTDAGGVVIRNNTVSGNGSAFGGVVLVDLAGSHLVQGNIITGFTGIGGAGLAQGNTAPTALNRIEGNIITNNYYGVMAASNMDLGGGSAGSTGGNQLYCNGQNDFYTNSMTTVTYSAQNNQWDHGTPSVQDLLNPNAAVINTTGATAVAAPCTNLWVSANGSAMATGGSPNNPTKTITYALTQAVSGDTVHVAPGTYDSFNGETFPITVPPYVSLIGYEAGKGNPGAANQVLVTGSGLATGQTTTTHTTVIQPMDFAQVAGLVITNTGPCCQAMGVILNHQFNTIRNNTILNNAFYGIYLFQSTGGHSILGNVIKSISNMSSGIVINSTSTAESRAADNIITANSVGVQGITAGLDLGGGLANSPGRNAIYCNTSYDVYTTGVTISAANNFWDHSPPNTTQDIWGSATSTNPQLVSVLGYTVCP